MESNVLQGYFVSHFHMTLTYLVSREPSEICNLTFKLYSVVVFLAYARYTQTLRFFITNDTFCYWFTVSTHWQCPAILPSFQ